jgi:multicomponent Na+:H+ antiporter subunit F
MIDTVVTGAQILLGLGAVLATTRAIRGPRIVDRIVALDAVLLMIAAAVAAESARDGRAYLAPIVVVVALVAFAGTVLVARFIEWRDT